MSRVTMRHLSELHDVDAEIIEPRRATHPGMLDALPITGPGCWGHNRHRPIAAREVRRVCAYLRKSARVIRPLSACMRHRRTPAAAVQGLPRAVACGGCRLYARDLAGTQPRTRAQAWREGLRQRPTGIGGSYFLLVTSNRRAYVCPIRRIARRPPTA